MQFIITNINALFAEIIPAGISLNSRPWVLCIEVFIEPAVKGHCGTARERPYKE